MKQFTLHSVRLEVRAPIHWSDAQAAKRFSQAVELIQQMTKDVRIALRAIDPQLTLVEDKTR